MAITAQRGYLVYCGEGWLGAYRWDGESGPIGCLVDAVSCFRRACELGEEAFDLGRVREWAGLWWDETLVRRDLGLS